MSFRRTLLAASALALSLVFVGAAASAGTLKAPTNLRITATGETSISLAWDAAKNSGTNWWYCIQRDGLGCIRVDPPKTTFTNNNLWPGTTFNYSVVAVNSKGHRSASSNTVTYTTPADTTPPTAPTLSLVSVYPMRASLQWTRSTDNRTQVWYTLLINGQPHFRDDAGFAEFRTVLDLSPSTTYEFQITARDYFGNTSASNVLSVTTPAATNTVPPTAPSNLRLTFRSNSEEAWLEWDGSTDDADSPGEIIYEMFLNGVRVEREIGALQGIVYCNGSGTGPIAVRAVDTSGNASGFSNEVVWC
jgi:chitodextrinase